MRVEAIVYFDGPLTKWSRSKHNWKYSEIAGVRLPLGDPKGIMPAPDDREVVDRKPFKSVMAAQLWINWRLKGFDKTKLVGEVRPA